MDLLWEIVFFIQSIISLEFCLATMIFEFKRDDVFSNTIFSIVCSFLGNQSRWSFEIDVTTLARFCLRILVASNLKNNPDSTKLILRGYWAAL